MKHIFLLLLVFNAAYAQKIKVVDDETNEPVPFATILLLKNDKEVFGNYCNDMGEGIINFADYDVASFSCVGFAGKKINKADIKEGVIKLKKTSYELDEVVITNGAIITLGEFAVKRQRWLTLSPQHMASYFYESDEAVFIKSLVFKVDVVVHKTAVRVRMLKRRDYVQDLYVGDKVFSYDSFIPDTDLVQENMIFYIEPQKKKGVVEIDLSSYNIELPKGGAFIALECLGYYDENGLLVENVKNPTKIELHVSATDNYCLRYNLMNNLWINMNKWVKGDFKYGFNEEGDKKNFVAPTFGLKVIKSK